MCAKVKRSKLTPGNIHRILTRQGVIAGLWGFDSGSRYNARIESIPTFWKSINSNRGIMQVDSFWEKDKEFIAADHTLLNLGVLYNDNMEFALITQPADELISKYHHRMPLIIPNDQVNTFMEKPEIFTTDFGKVKLTA